MVRSSPWAKSHTEAARKVVQGPRCLFITRGPAVQNPSRSPVPVAAAAPRRTAAPGASVAPGAGYPRQLSPYLALRNALPGQNVPAL